jgi:hypothetical protein
VFYTAMTSLSHIPSYIYVFRIVNVWSVYLKFLANSQPCRVKMLLCTRRLKVWSFEKLLIENELKKTAVVNKTTRTLIWCWRQLDQLTDTNSAPHFSSANEWFVVDRVALREVSLQVRRFSPVIIPPERHTHISFV